MTVINTNVSALYAQGSITQNTRALQQTMTQLSSGKRINGAADDAAGLSISARLTSQVRGLNQAIRNANDAISMIQTAEGATDAITNMLQRMRELTIQAGNSTNGTDDKAAAASEYDALATEIDRVANSTTWNGMHVLSGSKDSAIGFAGFTRADLAATTSAAVGHAAVSAASQAARAAFTASHTTSGAYANGASQWTADFVVDASGQVGGNVSMDLSSMNIGAGYTAGSVETKGISVINKAFATDNTLTADESAGLLTSSVDAGKAASLVLRIDDSIKFVNQKRSQMGATINRLQYTVDNLTNISTNTAASKSRIEDVDYSTATSDLAKHNIIQQAATAMLAQANQQPQAVLQLLK